MQDPAQLTATEAARLIGDGRLDPLDLMEACLERIGERERQVRAFAWFNTDEVRRGGTARQGPLHGLPIGVKDVLDTEVRGKLQATFGLEVTDQPMTKLRQEATPHILRTTKDVTDFFKERFH